MSDLIERLRTEPFNHWKLRHKAADEIEGLMSDCDMWKAENERLTAELAKRDASCQDCPTFVEQDAIIERLRAALEEKNNRLDDIWTACKTYETVGQIKTAVMNIARHGTETGEALQGDSDG